MIITDKGGMSLVGITDSGYNVLAIPYGKQSPMQDHKGGEIAVDDEARTMYAWEAFVVAYGTDSIMKSCNSYKAKKG